MAHAAQSAGMTPVVFDPAGLASAASGNPLALVMPRLDASDTVQARLLVDAFLHARELYSGMPGIEHVAVRQPPRNKDERARFAKVLSDPPLPLEDLEALADGGLLHKGALILRPKEVIDALLTDIETKVGTAPNVDLEGCSVDGQSFDAIIIASGMALSETAPWLGLVGKLGQVEHVNTAPDAPASALAAGHYALASGAERLWGATFEHTDTLDPQISQAAFEANATALDRLSPWWLQQIRGADIESRAGIRATTPDRLPIGGAMPDLNAAKELFAPLSTGREVRADAPIHKGIYLIGGLGSRGFTFAPWLASLVTAQLQDAPRPASLRALQAVSAMRFIHRALKRGQPI
ncbi:MAG: FAD-dependent 5-carboxymethylaminomethyl-2-thiouridine(34) oxidoreductase MnmC [Pseudomonadota bacterium]